MTASDSAIRPLFKMGGTKFGVEKMREKEFLSSPVAGETAFFQVRIPTSAVTVPRSAADVLTQYATSMTLGETAQFVIDFQSMDEKTKDMFLNEKLHKGQYKSLPKDAVKLMIGLDFFRIVRGGTEHCRPNRYGTGTKAFGSYM